MSVASHLKIQLSEYDRRIRTFVPHYEEMLAVVAQAVSWTRKRPTIVDLGVGTGALAARCLTAAPRAKLIGIDADADVLPMAKRRLARKWRRQFTLIRGDFGKVALPACDALVATLALHHIRSARAKERFYRRCFHALRRGGILVTGDAFLARSPSVARHSRDVWQAHLGRTYGARGAKRYLAAWASEDRYFPLETEMAMLARSGFTVDVIWRRPPVAVLMGRKD